MVVKRKKKTLDGIDRDILRTLIKTNRQLSSRQIAQKVNLSGASIMPRLNNLKTKGIIKPKKIQGLREFERKFKGHSKPVKIKAPRSILWGIDFMRKKKKKRK